MPDCRFENFDITIRGSEAPYSVTAEYRQQSAEGVFDQDITQEAWRQSMLWIEQSIFMADENALVAAGSRLYENLMRGQVRDLWMAARADLDRGAMQGLRIRLALRPPAVAALPWESLYDPGRNVALAASGKTPLVRVENLHTHVGPPRRLDAALPLKVLVAAPEDPVGIIDADAEIEGMQNVLKSVGNRRMEILPPLVGRFTVTDLRRRLHEDKPDILHMACHGEPEGLLLWRYDRPAIVASSSLRATLERATSLKLVFLNACLAGKSSEIKAFTTVAPQLLQAGVPAVIAMQFEIRDDAAIDFAQFLYEELLGGGCPGAIDAAVAYARSSLYALEPGDFSFGTPVLWLNAASGQVFELPDAGIGASIGATNGKLGRHAPDGIDLDREARAIATLAAETDLSLLPVSFKFVATRWQSAIRDLQSLITQLRHLQVYGTPEQTTEKMRLYEQQKAAVLRLRQSMDEIVKHHSGSTGAPK